MIEKLRKTHWHWPWLRKARSLKLQLLWKRRWDVNVLFCLDSFLMISWSWTMRIGMIPYNTNATNETNLIWAPSSEFVSSSIPAWQILTAHAQPFRGARDLAFCLKVPLDLLLVWASSEGSGETARMRRLAWTFAARIGDKYKIRLTRSISCLKFINMNNKVFVGFPWFSLKPDVVGIH